MTATDSAAARAVSLVRQPVLDGDGRVVLSRILLHDPASSALCFAGPRLLADSALLVDLERAVGNHQAVIGITEEALVTHQTDLFEPERVVFSLAGAEEIDDEILAPCRKLRSRGFRLAIDGLDAESAASGILDLVHWAFCDWPKQDASAWTPLIETCRDHGVQAVALGIDTLEDRQAAEAAGFDLYLGDFLEQPRIVATDGVPASKIQMLQLLNEIYRPGIDFDEIETTIQRDVTLTYKLLRYINSARFGLRTEVSSIKRALVVLGEAEVKRWVTLIAMTQISSDRPAELLRQSVVRARFCESLGQPFRLDDRRPDLFLVGMFSSIDALMGRPMREILEPLPVADDVKDALLGGSSALRPPFECSIAFEKARFSALGGAPADEETLGRLYVDALEWGRETLDQSS